jgi:hypothetical protein
MRAEEAEYLDADAEANAALHHLAEVLRQHADHPEEVPLARIRAAWSWWRRADRRYLAAVDALT